MTFREACQAILDDPKADPYAKTYANAGLRLTREDAAYAIPAQAMYILSNLSHWRAPQAKEVRATLRRIGGVK